jgi:uncharacterized protein YkwD
MAPRSLDDTNFDIEEEGPHGNYYQQQHDDQTGLYQEQQPQEDGQQPFNFDAYYGANHSPPSLRQDRTDIAMFKSRRDMRHRRTDSRNRSLWHRASRRLMSSLAASSAESPQVAPEPRAEPSRKHSSLMVSSQKNQQQQNQPEQAQTRRHQTWYYSSNHVLVNRERLAHGLPPMMRSVLLDQKSRQVAQWAAEGKDLKDAIDDKDAQTFVSGNVLVGGSIREIHCQTLVREACQRERNNLLNPEYREFGMGTYKDPESGLLYMCQLFGAGQ